MKPYIEKITRECENGFRDRRSVIDSIFVLKIINQEIWEYNQIVQYLFNYFQKAYDSIHRDTLWKCMEEFKMAKKLISICKTCVQKQEVLLEQKEYCHPFFQNNTGLKQGDALSTVLFKLALQKVIEAIKLVPSGIEIGKEQWNVLAYADGIV